MTMGRVMKKNQKEEDREMKRTHQIIHKTSSLQNPTHLDLPGSPQVKCAPEPGVMRSPLPGSDAALASRCLISNEEPVEVGPAVAGD